MAVRTETTGYLNETLTFRDMRFYLFLTLFVTLSVAVPWFCHMIHPLAGPLFLPLFFFILLAGDLFGWRMGLLVGMATPLISFVVSGMPPSVMMPRILTEAAVMGVTVGCLSERMPSWRYVAVPVAIMAGHLGAAMVVSLMAGAIAHGFTALWRAACIGWPGLLIQVFLIPPLASYIASWRGRGANS